MNQLVMRSADNKIVTKLSDNGGSSLIIEQNRKMIFLTKEEAQRVLTWITKWQEVFPVPQRIGKDYMTGNFFVIKR